MRRFVVLPAVLLFAASMVRATPIIFSFSVGFPVGAPTNPVTGSVVYDAASITADITSLTAIDLTIAGHVYVLGEVGFIGGPIQVIGGTLNFVTTVVGGTTDFVLAWDRTTLAPISVVYSAPGLGIQTGSSFPQFSFTAAPEPTTLQLCCFGVLVIAGVRRIVPASGLRRRRSVTGAT